MTPAQKSTRSSKVFTKEERSAMQERARELKVDKEDGESLLLAKVAEMKEPDRSMAKRIHAIIKANVPSLSPTTWYGMPAYSKDDKVICHFQPAAKFMTRYSTLGFSDKAHLDEGHMWPNAYALTELTATEEAKIVVLVKKAIG